VNDVEIFLYGALGAMLGAFIVQLLPLGYALASGKLDRVPCTLARLVGVLIITVGLVAMGGVTALWLGDAARPTEAIQAIVYGLCWQSTIGGLLNAKSSSSQSGDRTSGLSEGSALGSELARR
jgi:hypothetical protein